MLVYYCKEARRICDFTVVNTIGHVAVRIVTPGGVEEILEGYNARHTFTSSPGKILKVELLNQERVPCCKDEIELHTSYGLNNDVSLNTLVSDELRKRASTVKLTDKTDNLKGN